MPDENPAARSVSRASPGDGAPGPLIERCICGLSQLTPITAYGLDLNVCHYCATWHQRVENQTAVDVDRYYDNGYHHDPLRHDGVKPYSDRYDSDLIAARARLKSYTGIVGKDLSDLRCQLWLDIGCGNCAFADVLNELGAGVVGIDPDPVYADGKERDYVARARISKVIDKGGRANVVTYHDVIEHLVDPLAELKLAVGVLEPGGILIVEIPDVFVTAGVKHFKREHLWYFSGDGLELMGAALNLRQIAHYQPIPGKRTIVWRRT